MTSKEGLHRLIDELPEALWSEAERYLQGLTTTDPVLRALLLAPLDDEPLSPEEEAALAKAEAEAARGDVISWETYRSQRQAPA
ncbi:MAG TPA: hypothetical protein VII06_18735 [Chloroflexota bacterium]|jgi:hypothetical protein